MKQPDEKLKKALSDASLEFYGKDAGYFGMGGSIPFLNELESKYPNTVILAFGVLGPHSNAHSPNESLNLPFTEKLICSVTAILEQ